MKNKKYYQDKYSREQKAVKNQDIKYYYKKDVNVQVSHWYYDPGEYSRVFSALNRIYKKL